MNRKHLQKLLRARKGKRDAVLQLTQHWSADVVPGNPMERTRPEVDPKNPGRTADENNSPDKTRRRFL